MKLNNGEVIAFPTDTVYGIGAKFDDLIGQEKIIAIKGRLADKRFAVLCSSIEQIRQIAIVDKSSKLIIDAFMPGQLTIILPSLVNFHNYAVNENVAIRIPNHQTALKILESNGPLATTSVNITGDLPINDFKIIKEKFADKIDYIVEEENYCPSNIASTLIELSGGQIRIIRQGLITKEMIEEAIKR